MLSYAYAYAYADVCLRGSLRAGTQFTASRDSVYWLYWYKRLVALLSKEGENEALLADVC